jgi:hypothetical protein
MFRGLRLHNIGPLHRGLQVPHLPAQINVIDLEDISIGIIIGHRPDGHNEHEHIHDRELRKVPVKVENDQQSLRGHGDKMRACRLGVSHPGHIRPLTGTSILRALLYAFNRSLHRKSHFQKTKWHSSAHRFAYNLDPGWKDGAYPQDPKHGPFMSVLPLQSLVA